MPHWYQRIHLAIPLHPYTMVKKYCFAALLSITFGLGCVMANEQTIIAKQQSRNLRSISVSNAGYKLCMAEEVLAPNTVEKQLCNTNGAPKVLYVLDGKLKLKIKGAFGKTIKAGQGFPIPSQTVYNIQTGSQGVKFLEIWVAQMPKKSGQADHLLGQPNRNGISTIHEKPYEFGVDIGKVAANTKLVYKQNGPKLVYVVDGGLRVLEKKQSVKVLRANDSFGIQSGTHYEITAGPQGAIVLSAWILYQQIPQGSASKIASNTLQHR